MPAAKRCLGGGRPRDRRLQPWRGLAAPPGTRMEKKTGAPRLRGRRCFGSHTETTPGRVRRVSAEGTRPLVKKRHAADGLAAGQGCRGWCMRVRFFLRLPRHRRRWGGARGAPDDATVRQNGADATGTPTAASKGGECVYVFVCVCIYVLPGIAGRACSNAFGSITAHWNC